MEFIYNTNLQLSNQFLEVYKSIHDKPINYFSEVKYYGEYGYGIHVNFLKENFQNLFDFYSEHKSFLKDNMRIMLSSPNFSKYHIHYEKWISSINVPIFGCDHQSNTIFYKPTDNKNVKNTLEETEEAWGTVAEDLFEKVYEHTLIDKTVLFRAEKFHTIINSSNHTRCIANWPSLSPSWQHSIEYCKKHFDVLD